jgi:hypothetical protein
MIMHMHMDPEFTNRKRVKDTTFYVIKDHHPEFEVRKFKVNDMKMRLKASDNDKC